jgi:hypothetical protein
MTVYAHPLTPCATRFSLTMVGNVFINQSPLNKTTQRVEFHGDLWLMRAEFPPMSRQEFAVVEAFWNQLRGTAHTFRIWHMGRPMPYGTLRGSPLVAVSHPMGANSITMNNVVVGATLIAGDMLGITTSTGLVQLCQVTTSLAVADSNGDIFTTITPPLRHIANAGAAVFWSRPTAEFVLTSLPNLTESPAASDGFTIEAIEVAT